MPEAAQGTLLSLRQKVESPGLSKRRFCAFDWPKRRYACLGLSSFWRNDVVVACKTSSPPWKWSGLKSQKLHKSVFKSMPAGNWATVTETTALQRSRSGLLGAVVTKPWAHTSAILPDFLVPQLAQRRVFHKKLLGVLCTRSLQRDF